MSLYNGAHMGADGRWIAIPIRGSDDSISGKTTLLGLGAFATAVVLTSLWVMQSPGSSAAPWLKWASIGAWGLIGLWFVIFVAHYLFVLARKKFIGTREDEVLPIRVTKHAARIPLLERTTSKTEIQRWKDYARSKSDGPLPASFEAETHEFDPLTHDQPLDELVAARGFAAWLRMRYHRAHDAEHIDWDDMDDLMGDHGVIAPLLWVIDDVEPVSAKVRDGTAKPRTRWRVNAGQRFWNTWYGLVPGGFFALGVLLKIVGSVVKIPKTVIVSDIIFGVFIFGATTSAISFAVWWWRSRCIVEITNGTLEARLAGGGAEPISLHPDDVWAVVYRRSRDDDSNKPSMAYGEVHWRFLLSEAPHHIDVPNFDPRGTPWWDYVLELETAPIESRVYGMPADGDHANDELTTRQEEPT